MCFGHSFVFLFLENYGIRKLEAVFAVLIATMGVSFAWMFGQAKPSGSELLIGEAFFVLFIQFLIKTQLKISKGVSFLLLQAYWYRN